MVFTHHMLHVTRIYGMYIRNFDRSTHLQLMIPQGGVYVSTKERLDMGKPPKTTDTKKSWTKYCQICIRGTRRPRKERSRCLSLPSHTSSIVGISNARAWHLVQLHTFLEKYLSVE